MEHKFITFQTTQQIIRFVNLVSKLDFDVEVKYGSRIVDAKSILGILSLYSIHSLWKYHSAGCSAFFCKQV